MSPLASLLRHAFSTRTPNWIRRLFSPKKRPIAPKSREYRLSIDTLDERILMNAAPVATNLGPVSILHGNMVNLDLSSNVTDADNDPLTFSIVQQPTFGYAYIDSYTGQGYYYPYGNYTGPDSFTFRANDGALSSNLATASIDVTDQAPVASNLSFSILHGNMINLDLSSNVTDADNDALTYSIVQQPSYGYAYVNPFSGQGYYYSYGNYTGPDSFTFQVNDGALSSNIATASISVTDQAPVASNLNLSVLHGNTVNLDLSSNVTDADNDALTYSIVQQPSYGYAYINPFSGQGYYYSYGNYTGPDSFAFQVNDGALNSNIATASITVTDQAPIASNLNLSVLHGNTVNLDLSSNVTDADNDALTYSIVQQPSYGYAYINPFSGQGYYYSYGNYTGPDSFTFQANDGALNCNVATASINVTDQAPVASNLSFSVLHGNMINLALANNVTDADSDSLTYSIVQQPTYGYAYVDPYSGYGYYYPYGTYTGPDTFTFQANDGALNSNVAAVSINIMNTVDELQAIYESTVSQADALLQSSVLSAQSQYASNIGSIVPTADGLYAAYYSAVNSSAQIYQWAHDLAQSIYDTAIQQASSTAGASVSSAYEAYVIAFLAAQNPAEEDAAWADAQSLFDAAWAVHDTAISAAWDVAQAAENAARETYSNAEVAAWNTYENAWNSLTALNGSIISSADASYSSALNSALATWATSESTAWQNYTAAVGVIQNDPALLAQLPGGIAPLTDPRQPVFPSNPQPGVPSIAIQPRLDPNQPMWVSGNGDGRFRWSMENNQLVLRRETTTPTSATLQWVRVATGNLPPNVQQAQGAWTASWQNGEWVMIPPIGFTPPPQLQAQGAQGFRPARFDEMTPDQQARELRDLQARQTPEPPLTVPPQLGPPVIVGATRAEVVAAISRANGWLRSTNRGIAESQRDYDNAVLQLADPLLNAFDRGRFTLIRDRSELLIRSLFTPERTRAQAELDRLLDLLDRIDNPQNYP